MADNALFLRRALQKHAKLQNQRKNANRRGKAALISSRRGQFKK